MDVPERVREQLSRIVAPVEVAIPPCNAVRELMMLPSGQIRHYGFVGTEHDARRVYIASDDFGLSWQEYETPAGSPGAVVQSPWSGDFLTIQGTHERWVEKRASILSGLPKGLFLFRSGTGVDGEYSVRQVADEAFWIPRQPMPLRSRQRWLLPCQFKDTQQRNHPAVLLSDDDGGNWRPVVLETGPRHEIAWPHRGIRWQNYGCEPTVVELAGGRLWMLIRTSTDHHYEAFSDDAGETWTKPAPSRFFGTLTMPTLLRLRDGRILHFWCNTTPLPELDHSTQPELHDWAREGFGEDFFTNRDAFHAAISDDDGATWRGFREVRLSPIRNDADYRVVGGNEVTLDKSMHQSQAIELPTGHVLISHGQHPACRRIVIFDPKWLNETEREETFRFGLGNVSGFQYLKSIAGNYRGFHGHCAYNRRPGAVLVPSPDGELRDVVHLARVPDPRLLHEQSGVVWNFPAGVCGEVQIELHIPRHSGGVRVCLLDRWINPVDALANHYAIHSLDLTDPTEGWSMLVIRWTPEGAVWWMGQASGTIVVQTPSRNGVSYLHLQTLAQNADPIGVFIRKLSAQVQP